MQEELVGLDPKPYPQLKKGLSSKVGFDEIISTGVLLPPLGLEHTENDHGPFPTESVRFVIYRR